MVLVVNLLIWYDQLEQRPAYAAANSVPAISGSEDHSGTMTAANRKSLLLHRSFLLDEFIKHQ